MQVSMVECWVMQYTQGTEVNVDIVDESKVCYWRDKQFVIITHSNYKRNNGRKDDIASIAIMRR